ncbi:Fic family protein [Nocardioides pelophilus]|uniref:Fic family protein n=1 Tax=Nocardioides pelophilus TaxID=2172019 RepID=UPI001603C32E|nr:Fic family protein [Nocardioides pelophilus]
MDVGMFVNEGMGSLVPISGTDLAAGPWEHQAFVPVPLASIGAPDLEPATYLAIANARAALAALDATARQLPNPQLLRRPTLQREAQSTSALEGTYAPLTDVLTADDDPPPQTNLREIVNYVVMATQAFRRIGEGRPLTTGLLCDMQRTLVEGTKDEGPETGRVRRTQVAVGRRRDAAVNEIPVKAARFIPSPPGQELDAAIGDLITWVKTNHSQTLDPVVAAAMAHYQFEALHPFHDGNGRIGRLLIVLQLYMHGVLSEPTLTVSPWFEGRRTEYYDRLLDVSCTANWNDYVGFFATGIQESADLTHRQMLALVKVQESMKDRVRASSLRAENAHLLVDFAVANTSFTVRGVQSALQVSYGRANTLVQQLVELAILQELRVVGGTRRFSAPDVVDVIVNTQ